MINVDDKQSAGELLHILDAAVLVRQSNTLALHHQNLFFGERLVQRVRIFLQLLEPFNAALDGGKIGQGAAQPALYHIVHAAAVRFALKHILGLLFGAHKEHCSTALDDDGNGVHRCVQAFNRLLHINDMDAVFGGVNERFVVGIPAAGEVPKMSAGADQIFNSNFGGTRFHILLSVRH